MGNLTTNYMGIQLKSPIVPSASPLSREIDNLKAMEDAGAGAIVLDSLFEEEINFEAEELHHFFEASMHSSAEATSYYPEHESYITGPEMYLERIEASKKAVDIPIIASLNGIDAGDWTATAKLIEKAGADALELNIYLLETSFTVTSNDVESRYMDIVKKIKSELSIPVAVKLGSYFSAFPSFAKKLSNEADALVLFNRFYQPDLDIEKLEPVPLLHLSTSAEMLLPLRWIAILYGNVNVSLAHTTGIHTVTDVVKAIMAGADVAMVASVLLSESIGALKKLNSGLSAWMDEHEYKSIDQMKGCLSLKSSPSPSEFTRANYMKILRSYTV